VSDVATAIEDAPESVRATTPLTGFLDLVIRSVLPLLLALVAGGILIAALGHNPFGFYLDIYRGGIELSAWQDSLSLTLGATGVRHDATTADDAPGRPPAAEPSLPIAVVGAHLSGLPLNKQLTERGGVLYETTRTAACYRLFALPGAVPPKPGLLRVGEGGAAVEVGVFGSWVGATVTAEPLFDPGNERIRGLTAPR